MNEVGFLRKRVPQLSRGSGGNGSPFTPQTALETEQDVNIPRQTGKSTGSDKELQTVLILLSDGKQQTAVVDYSVPAASTVTATVTTVSVSTPPTTATPQGASTPTAPPNISSGSSQSSSKPTGLIAGISVLAILLAMAIGTIVWLVLRKRHHSSSKDDLSPASTAVDGLSEPHPSKSSREYKTAREPSTSSLETSLIALERQLHAKDTELRQTKSLLLESGRRLSTLPLSNQQIRVKFAFLVDAIDDWVMTAFGRFEATEMPSAEALTVLQRVAGTDYQRLLRGETTKHAVLRAVVADIIAQAFVTDQFFGDVAFAELKGAVGANASHSELHQWRALTVSLLSRTPAFKTDRVTTAEDVAKKIDYLVSKLAQRKHSSKRLAHLREIIDDASALALELAMQRVLIKVDRPGMDVEVFGEGKMEVLDARNAAEDGDEKDVEKGARGRQVRLWVFPAVVRYGDDSGRGYEKGEVLCRAKVVV